MQSSFQEFVDIVYRLRKECPWDREQTNQSNMANTIEEAYEVVEAIEHGNDSELKKELGDLLPGRGFRHSAEEEKTGFWE